MSWRSCRRLHYAVREATGRLLAADGRLAAWRLGSRLSMPSVSTGVLLAGRYRLDDRIAAGRLRRGVVGNGPCAGQAGRRQAAASRLRSAPGDAGPVPCRGPARRGAFHEGIARVYDYGEEGPPHPPFLVMELVDGPSLAGVLASGPVDPARAMDVVAQAAAGLQAAHLAGWCIVISSRGTCCSVVMAW